MIYKPIYKLFKESFSDQFLRNIKEKLENFQAPHIMHCYLLSLKVKHTFMYDTNKYKS